MIEITPLAAGKSNPNRNTSPRPLRLFRIHEYEGYQFYVTLRYKDMDSDVCFRFTVATILEWLRARIGDSEYPDALKCPSPDIVAFNKDHVFTKCHYSKGYIIDISVIPEEGTWALTIKEPDSGKDGRTGVLGRQIVTNISLRKKDVEYIELGIKTTVLDPPDAEELPSTFRPAIIRTLLKTSTIEMYHINPVQYCKVLEINDESEASDFIGYIRNPDQQLPVVLFSYAISDMDEKSQVETTQEIPLSFLPYNANEFAHQTYGYGRTYVVNEKAISFLSNKLPVSLTPGDVTFIEPIRFGGNITVYPFSEYTNLLSREALFITILQKVLYYTKRKKDYYFNDLLFEQKLRDHANDLLIKRTRETAEDKTFNDLYADYTFSIDQLKDANSALTNKNIDLENELKSCKLDIVSKQEQINQLTNQLQRTKNPDNLMFELRSIDHIPNNNKEIVDFFMAIFDDHIAFTERGQRTTSSCNLTSNTLWKTLYLAATDLAETYRDKTTNDKETAFQNKSGWEMASTETSQTMKNPKCRRQRRDTYNGKSIEAWAHIKIHCLQGDPQNEQRLHFWFDEESQKIIISYVGKHLLTAGTKRMNT